MGESSETYVLLPLYYYAKVPWTWQYCHTREDHSIEIYSSIHILFVKLFCLVQFFAWFVWTAAKILHTSNLVVTVMAAQIVDETSCVRERGNV